MSDWNPKSVKINVNHKQAMEEGTNDLLGVRQAAVEPGGWMANHFVHLSDELERAQSHPAEHASDQVPFLP